MRQFPYDACFNPRARVGRDMMIKIFVICLNSFNPRARVGRDNMIYTPLSQIHQFQSTRPRGARLYIAPSARTRRPSFNPRARVGRDRRGSAGSRVCAGFNPRARVGRDR